MSLDEIQPMICRKNTSVCRKWLLSNKAKFTVQIITMATEQRKHSELSKSPSNALPVAPSHIAYEALYRTDTVQ